MAVFFGDSEFLTLFGFMNNNTTQQAYNPTKDAGKRTYDAVNYTTHTTPTQMNPQTTHTTAPNMEQISRANRLPKSATKSAHRTWLKSVAQIALQNATESAHRTTDKPTSQVGKSQG
jgi:hypothetical protein